MATAPVLITHALIQEATDIALAMRWDFIATGYQVEVRDDLALSVFGPAVHVQLTRGVQWTDAEYAAVSAVANYALDRARAEVQS